MLIMDRDCKRGGERFAIPTQGEVQGKLVVLEVVAVTCLKSLLSSKSAAEIARLKEEIFLSLKEQCAPFGLSSEDQAAVDEYAREFFDAAKEAAARPSGASVLGACHRG
jgi:hypothetical protein